MKTAFAFWDNRIAPVFDTAQHLHVIESRSGKILNERLEQSTDSLPMQKARHLVELGIETLVCGAISRPMHMLIRSYGIRVIPFVAGDLQEVVHAWLTGRISSDTYAMPGCCRRRQRSGTGGCKRSFHKKEKEHGTVHQTPTDR
jgi:predicted Fe-Mo cluster-binding NifX family protein